MKELRELEAVTQTGFTSLQSQIDDYKNQIESKMQRLESYFG